MSRTLFGRPICPKNTAYFYPSKIDGRAFVFEMRNALNCFERDLAHYTKYKSRCHTHPRHIEEWTEHFLRMVEVRHEETSPPMRSMNVEEVVV